MNDSKSLSPNDIIEFEYLFSKYCKVEIAAGECHEYSCMECPINKAYHEIFDDYKDVLLQ